MKKYRVLFEVFNGEELKGFGIRRDGKREIESVEVEAGNKKLAIARGMAAFNRIPEYSGLYKSLYAVEEVK